MASTIEGYLAELRQALAGQDPALVQDAVYDAEDYLRSAAAEGGSTPEAIAAAIDAYGTPEEVAQAYRDAEITVAAALRGPAPAMRRERWGTNPFARFFGVVADPAAWGALFYLLLALVTGTIYFTIVVTGVSLTLGTLVLIVGIPLALLFLAVVRAVSFAEGRIVEGLLGVRMPRRPRVSGVQGNLLVRIKGWLTDYRTWTTMLYMLLQLPLGVTYFTVVVTSLALSFAMLVWPLVSFAWHLPFAQTFTQHYYLYGWAVPLLMALGVLGFVLTLWLAKGLGYLQGAYAKFMLVGRVEGDVAGTAAAPVVPGAPAADAAPVAGPAQGGDAS